MQIAIDGTDTTGRYRVDCECGTNWIGLGTHDDPLGHCPSLPIAEVVVHMKLEHLGELLELRFSDRFRRWLHHYWEVASIREFSDNFAPPRGGARV